MPATKFEDLSSFLRNLCSEKACIHKLFFVHTNTHKHGRGAWDIAQTVVEC